MSLLKRNEQEAQRINRLEATPVSRVEENDDAFTLTVELPGVGEKDIELTLENRTLSITAENTVQNVKDHTLVLNEIPEVPCPSAWTPRASRRPTGTAC
jgi:HSP20 family molecular chaperone IbpA